MLEVFDLPARRVFTRPVIPDDRAYLAYRRTIREAGADRMRPQADRPAPANAAAAQQWKREDRNVALVLDGDVGHVRQIQCLEALLFARQHRRYDQLEQPTEFIASILERDGRLRVYVGAGAEMFPPKAVYGFERVEGDIARGWMLAAVLHNHTIQSYRGRPALGRPVPSVSDVQLMRALATKLGMREARVTNGLFTGVVTAAELESLESR